MSSNAEKDKVNQSSHHSLKEEKNKFDRQNSVHNQGKNYFSELI